MNKTIGGSTSAGIAHAGDFRANAKSRVLNDELKDVENIDVFLEKNRKI